MTIKSRFQVKLTKIEATGSFEGRLSVYNVVDEGGDIVEAGAFTKTIQERGSEVPLLWQHKSDVPIGKLTLEDGPEALNVRGQLLMELPIAQQAYALLKAGIVKGLSIGYETIKKAMDGNLRRLQEVKLYEGSLVTFPMNELALVTSVKAKLALKDDFNTELAEIQLQDAAYQMRCALNYALASIVWDDNLTRDQRIAASSETIQQFAEAYMAYLPDFLDLLAQMYGGFEVMSKARNEIKSGRTISAATRESLQSAHDHAKSCMENIKALLDSEAGSSTSEKEAAAKPEPAREDHSAAETLIEEIRSLLPAA